MYHAAGLTALWALAHVIAASIARIGIGYTVVWVLLFDVLLAIAVYRYGRFVCA